VIVNEFGDADSTRLVEECAAKAARPAISSNYNGCIAAPAGKNEKKIF